MPLFIFSNSIWLENQNIFLASWAINVNRLRRAGLVDCLLQRMQDHALEAAAIGRRLSRVAEAGTGQASAE